MKYSISILVLCLIFSIPTSSFSQSQDRVVDSSNNGWYFYIGSFKLSDNFGLYSELHFRRANIISDPQQFLFRPGIDYFLNEHVVFTVGYTYILSYPYGEQPLPTEIPENNIWEQVLLKHAVGKVEFQHRYRFEQRWIGKPVPVNNDYEIDGTVFANRFRYRLTAKIPLFTISEEKNTELFLAIFDEIWFHLNDNLSPRALDQNWIYAALGYQFNAQGNIQLGFLDQYLLKPDGVHVENNPTLQVGFFYNLDFRN